MFSSLLGLDKFISADLIPAKVGAGKAVKLVVREVRDAFSPESLDDASVRVVRILRMQKAGMALAD